MYQKSPIFWELDSPEETMHVASATETTGSIPTPATDPAASQSYSQVAGVPQSSTTNRAVGSLITHAYVNPDTCIGCGVCESMCPDVFILQDDGLAHAISEPVPDHLVSDAESARFACPVSAIDVKSDDE